MLIIPFIFFVFNSGKKKREGLNLNEEIILESFVKPLKWLSNLTNLENSRKSRWLDKRMLF